MYPLYSQKWGKQRHQSSTHVFVALIKSLIHPPKGINGGGRPQTSTSSNILHINVCFHIFSCNKVKMVFQKLDFWFPWMWEYPLIHCNTRKKLAIFEVFLDKIFTQIFRATHDKSPNDWLTTVSTTENLLKSQEFRKCSKNFRNVLRISKMRWLFLQNTPTIFEVCQRFLKSTLNLWNAPKHFEIHWAFLKCSGIQLDWCWRASY